MPTISGLRRRGYPATAIRHFCEEVGTSRSDGIVDVAMLESAVPGRSQPPCTPSDVCDGPVASRADQFIATFIPADSPTIRRMPLLVVGS